VIVFVMYDALYEEPPGWYVAGSMAPPVQ